jgi:putative tricarboxylic transport membrane protein
MSLLPPRNLVLDRRSLLAGGMALSLTPGIAFANSDFPQRPLSLLVPANPGGGWDQLARLMQQVITNAKLAPKPVDVFNKGGAGGLIGLAEIMTRRRDDPYTVMVAGLGLIGSCISQHSPFMASESKPLARLIVENLMVAVPTNSPYKTMEDLISAIKADPASITWAGGSAGGTDHILVGLITQACGVSSDKVRFVAYSGGGEASSAIMGGQVSAAVAGYGEWKGLAQAGHIRVLATSAPERFDDKKAPTLKEAGLDIVFQNWRGVFAPSNAPPHAIAWWAKLLREMAAQPEWKAYLANKGWEDGFLDGEAFVKLIGAEERLYGTTLKQLGIDGTEGGNSPVGPWAFPKAIAALAVASGAGIAIEHFRANPGESIAPAGAEDDDEGGGPLPIWSRFLAGAVLIPVFIAALNFVGFAIATPIFILAICLLMRSATLKWDVAAAVGITAAIWLLFSRILSVALP